MKRFLLLAALLLLALLLAACGSSNNAATNDSAATSAPAGVTSANPITTAGLVDYQNPASGINLQYPAGWSVLEESGSALTLSSDASIATGVIPNQPYGMILVNITGRGMAGLSENPNSSELVSFLTSRFNSFGLPEGSITSPPTATIINGQPAATGSVIVDDGTANEVTNIFTIFVNNDRLVTTISLAPTAAIDSYRPTFDNITGSIALTEPNLALVEGVAQSPDQERGHDDSITYPNTGRPPVGGIHSPFWQNCGIYDQPIDAKNAIHSLEHGAVWITYQPTLAADAVAQLRSQAQGQAYVLLSPFPEQTSPIVLTAWGVQLELDTANDPRVAQFIDKYQAGPQTPEPGAACTGGIGNPNT